MVPPCEVNVTAASIVSVDKFGDTIETVMDLFPSCLIRNEGKSQENQNVKITCKLDTSHESSYYEYKGLTGANGMAPLEVTIHKVMST